MQLFIINSYEKYFSFSFFTFQNHDTQNLQISSLKLNKKYIQIEKKNAYNLLKNNYNQLENHHNLLNIYIFTLNQYSKRNLKFYLKEKGPSRYQELKKYSEML